MANIDLSRVNEATLNKILKDKKISTDGLDLYDKIFTYSRRFGTDNAAELYTTLTPDMPENPTQKKPKKTEIQTDLGFL